MSNVNEEDDLYLQNDIFPKSPLVLWTFGNITMERGTVVLIEEYGSSAAVPVW